MMLRTRPLGRFYLPQTNTGGAQWRKRPEVYGQNAPPLHNYQRTRPPDPIPYLEKPVNTHYGKRQIMTNPIVGKHGLVLRKVAAGYPGRKPVPEGLAKSWTHFDHFMYKYFPDVDCTLVLDSVLNNPNQMPMFLFPSEMSKPEIRSYLTNVYGVNDIKHVFTRNYSGLRYKNEFGMIKKFPAQKAAWLQLESPVQITHKSVKTAEEVD